MSSARQDNLPILFNMNVHGRFHKCPPYLLTDPQQSHLKFLKVTDEILDSGDFAVHQRQIPQFRETRMDELRVEGGVGPVAERKFSDLSPETDSHISWVNSSGYYMHHQV